eukprot:XP_025000856.1 uncharacterized protein LOC112530672 isoform X2 [Gallus gallus]
MTLEEEAVPPPQLRGRRVKVPRRRRAEGACRVKGVGRALCACAAVRGALPATRGGGACACGVPLNCGVPLKVQLYAYYLVPFKEHGLLPQLRHLCRLRSTLNYL